VYSRSKKTTGGRNGHVKSSNDVLDLENHPPWGGANDDYTNPEMLLQQVMQLVSIMP
jgi:organic hydroperoxide reductase OsmC/OhrA